MRDTKRRRTFKVYRELRTVNEDGGELTLSDMVAHGVLYDEGNVQVLWRKDMGFTAEQYDKIGQVYGIVEGANTIKIEEE